jgi:hypothetical protein
MRALAFSLLLLGVLLAWPSPARADSVESNEPPKPQQPYIVSLRGAAGLGGGAGFSMRAALSGEVWVDPYVGIGGLWGVSNVTRRMELFGGSDTESDSFVGAGLAFRSAPRGSYGQLGVGVAYAQGHRDNAYEQYDFSGAPLNNPPSQSFSYSGAMVNVSAAWHFHAGNVEIGPHFDLDLATWGTLMLTGNLVLGGVID